MAAGVSVKNFTRRSTPRLPYAEVANAALPGWDLSLAYVGPAKAKDVNEKLRGKSYVPNVLSYAAGVKSGEILICLSEAIKQAPAYGMGEQDFILYLFIHGLLHLKGWAHSATMERSERTLLARFAKSVSRTHLNVSKNRHRNRHRHVPGKTGGGRRARG